MQRDWEVVRQILLKCEQLGDTHSVLSPQDVSPYDSDNVSYHMKLLDEAGLIEAQCSRSNAGVHCWAFRLTWAGHEFLDNTRDQTVWNRVKSTAREKGLSLSFDVIKLAASAIIGGLMKP
jgi:Hypothetical protein (DUF2513)